MTLFSERHGLRKTLERTSEIAPDMYSLLFDCCEKYLNHLAWKFPAECDDWRDCCGTDIEKLSVTLKYKIPDLFWDNHNFICKPPDHYLNISDIKQYALLDFIEYIGKNCKDFRQGQWHEWFHHYHLIFMETNEIFETFRQDINEIFELTKLQYTLTPEKTIERTTEHDVMAAGEFEDVLGQIKDGGLKDLLDRAHALHRHRDPNTRRDAVEKLWDAFERLKTHHSKDKPDSAGRIVRELGMGIPEFESMFNEEFAKLTKIGNNFRIRHHETNVTNIDDGRHRDYLFNRCLSLVACAVKFLNDGGD